MKINEVCKLCGLTKKAIAYYEKQQLIKPKLLENGYRDFSDLDMERLKKISILRKLGLSASEIQTSLTDIPTELSRISSKKALETKHLQSKQALLQMLSQTQDWDAIDIQLRSLEQQQSILQHLLDAFPGYYGRYAVLHFAAYLTEPIATQEQQEALETIIDFLDNLDCRLPASLQAFWEETTSQLDDNFLEELSNQVNSAIPDIDAYINNHQESLKQYLSFRKTPAYQQSPAGMLQEFFMKFNQESGYNERFIPAMKKLSPSYQTYQTNLEKANQTMLQKYPSLFSESNF